ncbi:MAG TPA: hypothetical protein VIO36_14710 [Anaerolineaceae bacterium]
MKKAAFLGVLFLAMLALSAFTAPVSGASFLLTATITATPTVAPTAAPTASVTPAAEAPDVNGMRAWCWPKGSVVTKAQLDTDAPPANAKPWKLENETPTVITVNDACTFVYTGSEALAEGTQLQVLDASNAVWLKADLKPGTAANSGYAALQHGYIIDPPFWSVTYTIKVVTKDGAEKWSSPVVFRRGYEPGKCYDGKWPDPVTWYCYYPPDAHPWDSWYKYVNPKP